MRIIRRGNKTRYHVRRLTKITDGINRKEMHTAANFSTITKKLKARHHSMSSLNPIESPGNYLQKKCNGNDNMVKPHDLLVSLG